MVNTYIVDEDVIQSSSNFNLIMGVQNQGMITAHNLSVIIGNGSYSSGSSNTNFLPIGFSNICMTRDVLRGETVHMEQAFIVNSGVAVGIYLVLADFE